MDHIITDLNRLCSTDIYLRFADGLVRLCRAFYHLLVMDGAEVAAAHCCVLSINVGPPSIRQALLVSKTLHKSVALCKIRRRGI